MKYTIGIKGWVADLIGISGCSLCVYGIMLVNIPASFVLAGVFLICGAWMLAK